MPTLLEHIGVGPKLENKHSVKLPFSMQMERKKLKWGIWRTGSFALLALLGKSTGQQKTSVSIEWDLLLSSFLTLLLSVVSYLSGSVLKSWFTGCGLITPSRICWDISECNVASNEGEGVSASVTIWVQPVWWELEERWEGICHKELESAASVMAGATPAVSMLPVIGFPPPHPLCKLLQETMWVVSGHLKISGRSKDTGKWY